MIRPLTKRQREVYVHLVAAIEANGYAPTLEETGRALGLRSLATVHKHLTNLQEKGYLTREWGRSRSITLLVEPGYCPTCGHQLVDEAGNPLARPALPALTEGDAHE